MIMTVRGPIDERELGLTLPHEHVLVDFSGAETASPDGYDAEEVIERMLPFLQEAMEAGITGFVDCTPMYLARDVAVLRRLSEHTGLHIITNTGQYKEPFLPRRTLEYAAEDARSGTTRGARTLSEEWIAEWRDGIDGTGVRPGFIKTAVFGTALAPAQQTVITAAALTSRATGLPIATHTEGGVAALHILRVLERHGVSAERWIYIHANTEPDHQLVLMAARAGAWIELDGIGGAKDETVLAPLLKLLEAGFAKQILLSQDRGWYTVGEPEGGEVKPYTYLTERFVPLMRSLGIDDRMIHTMTVSNPARAFTVREPITDTQNA